MIRNKDKFMDVIIPFLPVVGLLLMAGLMLLYWSLAEIRPLPENIHFYTGSQGNNPLARFPFAVSSVVLVTFMVFMTGLSLRNIYLCAGRRGLGISVLLVIMTFLLVHFLNGGMDYTAFEGMFPFVQWILIVTNTFLLIMLLFLAVSLSFLSWSLFDGVDQLVHRVRMFKVQIQLASLLLIVGLLEVFLLYYWWYGGEVAKSIVLGCGLLYSGMIIVLFLPTALLLHRKALQYLSSEADGFIIQSASSSASSSSQESPERRNAIILSPIVGVGQYVATFLPALLGVLPSILGG